MRVIMVTSSIVLLLTFTSYFIYELILYRQITERQLLILTEIMANNSTAALAFDSPEEADEILSALKAERNVMGACLYDESGVLFSKYPKDLLIEELPSTPTYEGFRFVDNYIEGFKPVLQGEKKLGTLYIKRSILDIYRRLFNYTVIAAIVMILCFVFAYFLSKRLQKGISAPIISLAHTTRKVSQNHDYSIRAIRQTEDEIGLLTDAFNDMLQQIEIQNREIQLSREVAQQHAMELEIKVNERTIQYKKQKDFAEVILDASLVLIIVFDTDTKIMAFNKKCEEEFGLKKEAVIGKRFDEVFPIIKESASYANMLKALQGEVVYMEEYKSYVTGNYYESYMLPLKNEQGEIYAVLMTAHNISPIVESAEKLKQTNIELLRKNAELEQFAYVASHDLQEPLRKIQTFIQLVKNNNRSDGDAARYMDKIETSAGRMSMLIKDVLEYSKLSQLQQSFSELDLNVVLENVKSDLELLILQRNVQLHSDKLPVIYGNRLQLHQLFMNLINNSIKFCDTTPIITISSAELNEGELNLYSDLNVNNKHVKLMFADNGIGFEQEFADKIFTIFQRLNTRDKYEGTGIGLALCKKIVENHNGHINADSTPGKGTTFTIILPVASDVIKV
jgi:PAS domain S-box-containing protein